MSELRSSLSSIWIARTWHLVMYGVCVVWLAGDILPLTGRTIIDYRGVVVEHHFTYYVVCYIVYAYLLLGALRRSRRFESLACAGAYIWCGLLEFYGSDYERDGLLTFTRVLWIFGIALIIIVTLLRSINTRYKEFPGTDYQ